MAVPLDPTDPRNLTPEQRLDELAAILATGVRRVLALRISPTTSPLPPPPEQIPPESSQNCLEVFASHRRGRSINTAKKSIAP